METERGVTPVRVILAGPETNFEVDTPARPLGVTLDPRHGLLARIAAP